jgi:hypothetical protein
MVAYYTPQLVPNLGGLFPVELDFATCLFALWRGQRDERFVACVFLATLAAIQRAKVGGATYSVLNDFGPLSQIGRLSGRMGTGVSEWWRITAR